MTHAALPRFFCSFPCERDGEGGKKPIMGRPCARAHRCVRLSQTKKPPKQLIMQWRLKLESYKAMTPTSVRGHFGMEMPSARDCPMGVFTEPRHRKSREVAVRTATSEK
ncbi:hypothetical protein EVAR_8649_1 [Eumeta japonica]|uniref:Uncharacterized protein n=1 Tax=Eumeta variegata TaxID=151549 RepID=A0A4C1TUF0_EUMVA|nr:hypothetical protein EVAR_8649_1 [Eumeta japonica]